MEYLFLDIFSILKNSIYTIDLIDVKFEQVKRWKKKPTIPMKNGHTYRKITTNGDIIAFITYKKEDILDIEKVQRNKLKKNQVRW